MKSANTSRVSITFFYIFLADNFLSKPRSFRLPTPTVKQHFSTFPGFNYFSFVCEIMNIAPACFIDVEHFSIADFLSEVENQRKILIRLWSLQVRKSEMLSWRCKSEQVSWLKRTLRLEHDALIFRHQSLSILQQMSCQKCQLSAIIPQPDQSRLNHTLTS